MYQIVTMSQWEYRAPNPLSRREERYWACAELPLNDQWTFVVNTSADSSRQLAERSIAVVSIERLLDVLAELGLDRVRSVYVVSRGTNHDSDALSVSRIEWIEMGEDAEDGWRKVFAFHTQSGQSLGSPGDFDAILRMTNRVEVARFAQSLNRAG